MKDKRSSGQKIDPLDELTIAESRKAGAPLIEELQANGLDIDLIDVSNVFLVKAHIQALPILLRHLDRPYPENILNRN